jgi:hypothetical protein
MGGDPRDNKKPQGQGHQDERTERPRDPERSRNQTHQETQRLRDPRQHKDAKKFRGVLRDPKIENS